MIPDYFEPITAYRAFDVYPNGLLVGQAHAEPWPPYQPFVARCGHVQPDGYKDHIRDGQFIAAPVYRCDCGIHVLKSLQDAKQRVVDEKFSFSFLIGFGHERPKGRAWGAVKIWGRVIEHQIGYRAQLAYPSELVCESPKCADLIASLYGIPCRVEKLVEPERMKADNALTWYFSGPLTYQSLYPAPFGVISSVSGDVQDTPMVSPVPSSARIIAPPSVVGANRWQTRQYAKQLSPRHVQMADWRKILREGFHKGVTA